MCLVLPGLAKVELYLQTAGGGFLCTFPVEARGSHRVLRERAHVRESSRKPIDAPSRHQNKGMRRPIFSTCGPGTSLGTSLGKTAVKASRAWVTNQEERGRDGPQHVNYVTAEVDHQS